MNASKRFLGPSIQVLLGQLSGRQYLQLHRAVHCVLLPIVRVGKQNTLSKIHERQLQIHENSVDQSRDSLKGLKECYRHLFEKGKDFRMTELDGIRLGWKCKVNDSVFLAGLFGGSGSSKRVARR